MILAAWLSLASAEPGHLVHDGKKLNLPQATYELVPEDGGSRLTLNGVVASPLAWEKRIWGCDGDEFAVGDATRSDPAREERPIWCPIGGTESSAASVIALDLRMSEGAFIDIHLDDGVGRLDSGQLSTLLQPLDPLLRVWMHGFFESDIADRAPCLAPGQDRASAFETRGGTEPLSRLGLSDSASVYVGVLEIDRENACLIRVQDGVYSFDAACEIPNLTHTTGFRGDLHLFDFSRYPACSDSLEDRTWAAKVELQGRASAASPRPADGAGDPAKIGKHRGPDPGAIGGPGDGGDDEGLPWWAWAVAGGTLCVFITVGVLYGVYRAAQETGRAGMEAGRGLFGWLKDKVAGLGATRATDADQVAESELTFAQELSRRVAEDWQHVYKEQDNTLKGLAIKREDYVRALEGNRDSVDLVEPFRRTNHQAKWQNLLDEMRVVDIAQWSDFMRQVAACLVVATMRAEADAFRKKMRPRQNKPAASSVILTILEKVGFQRPTLESRTPDVHPAADLALMVREMVDDLPPPATSIAPAEEDEGDGKSEGGSDDDLVFAKAEAKRLRELARKRNDRITDLERKVDQLEEKLKASEKNYAVVHGYWQNEVAKLAAAEAELSRKKKLLSGAQKKEAERANKLAAAKLARDNKLLRNDAKFLVSCFEQVYGYPALKEAVRHVADSVLAEEYGAIGPLARHLLQESEQLRNDAEVDEMAGMPGYTGAWRQLEEDLKKGLVLVEDFAAGAALMSEADAAEKLVELLIDRSAAYAITGTGADRADWRRGFAAWHELYQPADRQQGDGGRALGDTLRRTVFEKLVVPWLRLLQFLTEALPVECPGQIGAKAEHVGDVEKQAPGPLQRLGFTYEHVRLYEANRRDFVTRRSEVAINAVAASEVFYELEAPPEARPDLVVRLMRPLITKGPGGHPVRAQLWCLES